jgi:hypothetical protein
MVEQPDYLVVALEKGDLRLLGRWPVMARITMHHMRDIMGFSNNGRSTLGSNLRMEVLKVEVKISI